MRDKRSWSWGPGYLPLNLTRAAKAARRWAPAVKQTVRVARQAMGKKRAPTQTAQSRRAAPKKTYGPRGRAYGNYRGFFKKARRESVSTMLKYGSVINFEKGFLQTATGCSYVGHAVSLRETVHVVCQAIVRKLYRKAGITIKAFNARIRGNENVTYTQDTGSIKLLLRVDQDPVLANTLTIGPEDTYDNVAEWILSVFFSVSDTKTLEFQSIWLYGRDSGVQDQLHPLASVDFTTTMVHFACESYLTIQNRTAAATGAADETSALDVANNPVEGKKYSGWGTGVGFRFGNQSLSIADGLIANPLHGEIMFDKNAANVTSEMLTILRRPPPVSAFTHVTKSAKVRLGPGILKKDKISYSKSMKFNQWMKMFDRYFTESTGASGALIRSSFGKFAFFGLEKMCATGDLSEPNIVIGCEINQRVGARIVENTVGVAPFQLIL